MVKYLEALKSQIQIPQGPLQPSLQGTFMEYEAVCSGGFRMRLLIQSTQNIAFQDFMSFFISGEACLNVLSQNFCDSAQILEPLKTWKCIY